MPPIEPNSAPLPDTDIVAALENAQRLAMIGLYDEAQACLDALLQKIPHQDRKSTRLNSSH